MHPWAQLVVVVCVVVVTVALVAALVALRRAGERADRVLAVVEHQLQSVAAELEGLLRDLRSLSREARGEVERMSVLTEKAQDISDGVGRVLAAVAGLTRAGQLVGVVAGVKAGLDMFLHRLRKQQGDDDEQRPE